MYTKRGGSLAMRALACRWFDMLIFCLLVQQSFCGVFVLEIETKLMICENAIPKSELSLSAALCLKNRLSSAWLNISDKENITGGINQTNAKHRLYPQDCNTKMCFEAM